ncbi:unnamed protein product [Eruca vesicaria subsp. sativa]|uniref:Uncharacterized protein n=1 Tax=Eruca vesicaria subsp. sativa TaxID=29727 RepID=A0ABC8LG70_ERUVS|nr:unnamed protein product [Eruca vesicaria subsp. sativa]
MTSYAPAIRRYSPSSYLGPSEFFNQTVPGKIYEIILRAFSSSLSSPIPYFEDRENVTQLKGSDAHLAKIIVPKCLVMYNVSAVQPSLGVING